MTNIRVDKFSSLFFIILCLNSILYYDIQNPDDNEAFNKSDNNLYPDDVIEIDTDFDDFGNQDTIKQAFVPGNFKTKAFFGYDQLTTSLDIDGPGYEMVEYDDTNHDGSNLIETRLSVGSHPSASYNPQSTSYDLLIDAINQVDKRNSTMYSSELTNDTTISGKVHYLVNIHRDGDSYFNDILVITLRVTLAHFFKGNSSSKEISSVEYVLDTVSDINPTGDEYVLDVTLDDTIPEYTLAAGDRLKVIYEIKFSDTSSPGGHVTLQSLKDGTWGNYPSPDLSWAITDGIYSNTYDFTNLDAILGVQFYMREETYPDVQIYNVEEGSVYQTAETINIDVTDGTDSYYRWVNESSWISFENDTTTTIPTIHGWHTLEVSASELIYNNTVVKSKTVGFDATYDNLQLHNAIDGDKLKGGFVLDFTAYNVSTVSYMWDEDLNPTTLSSPYDITTSLYNGLHNLTVNTTDFYKTRIFNYQFSFDSSAPIISLNNVANDTFLLVGKTIEIEITDYSTFNFLNYSWDSGSIQNWVYDASNLYSTSMPLGEGDHWLTIFAEDEFGFSLSKDYKFFTSSSVFDIDLRYWSNETYQYGGEDVEFIVQQSNTTLYYSWDGDFANETKVTVANSLLLTGDDALSTSEGMHYVTIRSFNLSNIEHIFNFTFYVDRTAPVFDSSYLDYHNNRFLNNAILYFYITDNFIGNSSLTVQYSFDEKIYKFFDSNFLFQIFYTDGNYSLEIYAKDSAGNTANILIYITIDNTKPVIVTPLTITGLVDDSTHGNLFIPENTSIQVFVIEDDPGYRTFYRWNSGPKIEIFGSSFTLISTDRRAKLTIYANDTLGLEDKYDIFLTYDSTAPVISLVWPFNVTSAINDRTVLDFDIFDDSSTESIASIDYEWDNSWGLDSLDPVTAGEYEIIMEDWVLALYDLFVYTPNGYAFANLTITAVDKLGLITIANYMFEVDQYPPEISLFYLNGTGHYNALVDDGVYYVSGGTELWYDNSTNDDLASFEYEFEDYDEPKYVLEVDEWKFYVPSDDGNHTLTVVLYDTAGEGTSRNKNTTTYTFIVDDITVSFNDPIGFESGDSLLMDYNDTFALEVNVTDAFDGEIINGLNVSVYYDTIYTFDFTISNISTVYTVTIHALDVTNSTETRIDIRFFQGPIEVESGQYVTILLTVDKKEGSLTILEESDTSVEYYEDFEIIVNFQSDIGDNQSITQLYINGTEELDFDATETNCTFTYSSNIGQKGNYSLVIRVESLYYSSNPSINSTLLIEIRPIPILLEVWVKNATILEGQSVTIYANLTYEDGSPIPFETINFLIFVYYKNDTTLTPTLIMFAYADYNYTVPGSDATNLQGTASITFVFEENIDRIGIEANFAGTDILDIKRSELDGFVVTFPPITGGIPQWLLYTIIGGSIALAAIISFIIYKLTRPKSFEELLSKVTPEEMALNYSIMSPGIVLTIFDQRKGPIPLVGDHSLEIGRYIGRMRIGIENFLLKIADQAYSSLGFEEHDTSRRVGSIILPTEKMTGFVHGVQIPNKMARGGFENLSLIVLADAEYGTLLLNFQEHIYSDIDILDKALKDKKPLKEVEEIIKAIRIKSVQVMIAAQGMEEQQSSSE